MIDGIQLHLYLTFKNCSPTQTRTETSPGIHHIKLGPCYLHHKAIATEAGLEPAWSLSLVSTSAQ